jgi:WD40 repeat protein
VAVGEGSGIMAKVFTWDTGNSAGEMVGHTKRILSCAFKTRPFRIATASEDMRTIFYAGPPFKLDHSNATHTNFVNCLRYAPDGSKYVSVGSDKKIQVSGNIRRDG